MSNHIQGSPVIALTPGEPAGIGPDLAVMMAQEEWPATIVCIADPELLSQRAARLGLPLSLFEYSEHKGRNLAKGELFVKAIPLANQAHAQQLDAGNAAYILNTLDCAIDGCLDGLFSAMVTGPVHKGVINEAGYAFSGHTEYLQDRCGVDKVVMMLANRHLKVALASTHLPLKDVADYLTEDTLVQVLSILIADLKANFGIETPRILVAGLNPHAGEGGHMGMEEIKLIEPVLEQFRSRYGDTLELLGPLPADTLFTPKYLDQADAVLAMYHDQGLPVLKFVGFGESVNITLGLPMIRTSVDHGTAIDLAGTGNIDAGSMRTAMNMAIDISLSKLRADLAT